MKVFRFFLEEPVECECGHKTSVVFVLDEDEKSAEARAKEDGVCGECLADMLAEGGFEVRRG